MNDFEVDNKLFYMVEIMLPDEERPNRQFQSCYWYGHFTTVDDPGYTRSKDFSIVFPELVKNVQGEDWRFLTPAEAIAAAKKLEEVGRFVTGWAGPEKWREKRRGPLKCRVVEEHVLKTRRLINF